MDLAANILTGKLQIENITAGYDGGIIIKDVSFEVPQGDIVGIIGLSGVGKSTLFNVIAGLLKPYSGKVLLNGRDITDKPGSVGYMLQKDLLLPFKTVIRTSFPAECAKGRRFCVPIFFRKKQRYLTSLFPRWIPLHAVQCIIGIWILRTA